MTNPAISEAICAASVRIAKEPDMIPPIISVIMKKRHIKSTHFNLAMAVFPLLSLA